MNRIPDDDWRRQGQETYLVGLAFKRMAWSSNNPAWDHDHCEFCQTKLASPAIPDALHEGFGTPDLKHWLCPACFEDFRDEFQLALAL
jgi:hypothetical protein